MEQSGSASSSSRVTPKAPIIVLGKQNDYLFIGFTVEDAVENTRRNISAEHGDDGGNGTEKSKNGPFGLDDLEFFDIAGLRLEPVVVAGRLDDLVIKNYQQEIRDRIVEISCFVEREIRHAGETDPAFGEPPLQLPDESLDFKKFIAKLAKDNAQLTSAGERAIVGFAEDCNWISHIAGRC